MWVPSRALKATLVAVALILVLATSVMLLWSRGGATQDESLQRVQRLGKLTVGIDPSYPPFEYLSAEGEIEGYDVDLARTIARGLGVEPDFVSLDSGGLYDAVVAGKLDAAISSLEPAPEYADQLVFSHPYFNAGQVLLVRSGQGGVKNLRDLQGETVGVEASSEGDLKLRDLAPSVPKLKVRPFSTQEMLFDALRRREIAAAVVDRVAALPETRRTGSGIVGDPLTDVPFVIVSRRSDATLSQALDEGLTKLEREGFLRLLEDKWLR